MEKYLQYMKILRSQMNDVEDQATKVSVEEQMQLTTIQTLENDLNSAISETKRFMEDIEQMNKAKGQICSQIQERQRRIVSLESDSSTLIQNLELIEQERINLAAKLIEKSTYYLKVSEDITAKWQQQKTTTDLGEPGMVKDTIDEQRVDTQGKGSIGDHLCITDQGNNARKNPTEMVDSAKVKLDKILQMKSELVMENYKMKQAIEQENCRESNFKNPNSSSCTPKISKGLWLISFKRRTP
ncbi:PREDICTED: uncharacterized protein LOC101299248 isoform X2 [Fragaria vesca subsp. vesca]|uniref:uncharacterized protein LOC101299248 isoform X2 n=1 Tax=Fragaria vesca subsp. vesca TaxID=101020 RepID=UPI0002C333E4|nr:PREDICTED: uncharacterized protein LOC101299248 isoform X2 [Fragaria vesca subsp. vesca]XP_011457803.1 PREDICTED: uncharacterized protein LOC101299248 isoform X2 [Fragaria vesca subsp. vesca]